LQRLELGVAEALEERFGPAPELAVVLGSGLSPAADILEDVEGTASFDELGLRPVSVKGHGGRLVVGRLGATRAAFFQGRVHVYELLGADLEPVVRATRALAAWGVKVLVLTASTGSLRRDLDTGTLVRLTDYIDIAGISPLGGPAVPERGPRFVDMSEPYCRELGARLDQAAAELGVPWDRGVYAFSRGPAFETPAQVRMLGQLGGDVVGMSTVPETQAARQMGMRVAGISVVSNPGAGLVAGPLDHDAVLAEAGPVAERVGRVLRQAFSGGL